VQAKTIEHGIELIADSKFHLIFITYSLPNGTGLDLISRLNQLRADIPVIFTVNKTKIHQGAKAIAKGASAILAKEDISSKTILSIIDNTLKKAKLSRQIENARDRITLISKKDYLTRLYNRGCFEQETESEALRAKRYNTELSILIVDFDKFKKVNKNYGYDAGDVILSTSAALIQSMVRDSDMVCRFGGEEFGIVLPNTDANGARILARRIQKIIADHEFEKDSNILRLTVSIGIASYNSKTDTTSGILIKKALDALATAAKEGGNQIQTTIN
ncbi:MAG: diguanylate cyclase, partial [Desulfobacula sp.]|nr:diguanylate cyclase [Desulfobacula sp.]